nr:ABC transporter permease [Marinicella sp. W31]MDC2877055.1 ABC transporter permease [Marinicella sp. W31]
MSDTTTNTAEKLTTSDGKPLKASLAKALRRQKMRALLLIAPLLLFVLISFAAPIVDMLFRSVQNEIVPETLPRTVTVLESWDESSGEIPSDVVFSALRDDLVIAAERKRHTRLGSRLNYEMTGMSSLFRKTGRRVDDFGEIFTEQFENLNEAWVEPATWVSLMASEDWVAAQSKWAAAGDDAVPQPAFVLSEAAKQALPRTADIYSGFADVIRTEDGDSPTQEEPWNPVYAALYDDLIENPDAASSYSGAMAELLLTAAEAVPSFEALTAREEFIDADEDWGSLAVWQTLDRYSGRYTDGYYLAALDAQRTADGIEMVPEGQRIYLLLFMRTLILSVVITCSCLLLGYPVAFLLSHLPLRSANLLMILVLLPFWTSLLVRTSAWKVLLQQQGVINDMLVFIGLVSDDGRLALINNATGTVIAMTHILLPFMILPLYSVMKTISPTYVRAAKSLGATDWTAFWRIYFRSLCRGSARVLFWSSSCRSATTSRPNLSAVPPVSSSRTGSPTTSRVP